MGLLVAVLPLIAVLAASPSPAAMEVHTDLTRVHACAAIGERFLAAARRLRV